jgi:hypothetical protein
MGQERVLLVGMDHFMSRLASAGSQKLLCEEGKTVTLSKRLHASKITASHEQEESVAKN